jgi:hypothetical protein
MKYGISLGGNSSYKPGATPRNECRLFTRLEILLLPCEYIFSLMNFVVKYPKNITLKGLNSGLSGQEQSQLPK